MKKSVTKKLSLVVAIGGMLCGASALQAAEFGSKGTLVPSGSVGFSYDSSKPSAGDATKTTNIQITPALQYFVLDNVAVGVDLGYGYEKITAPGLTEDDVTKTTALGLGINAGYNLPLAKQISLFPQLGLGYGRGKVDTNGDAVTAKLLVLSIKAPVLFHFGNFFLGAGPEFSRDLSSKVDAGDISADGDKSTTIGVQTVIGGWI